MVVEVGDHIVVGPVVGVVVHGGGVVRRVPRGCRLPATLVDVEAG